MKFFLENIKIEDKTRNLENFLKISIHHQIPTTKSLRFFKEMFENFQLKLENSSNRYL